MKNQLKILSNPEKLHENISIEGQSSENLKKLLSSMILIRKAEQQLAFGRKKGLIGGPVHLSVGQEAIAVGVSTNLRKTDRVFGNHRSHAHILALNSDCYRLFAEVLGKKTGFSRGMGGSMHLFDKQNGFYGSAPIVAGTVPLAVGAAMAAKMQNTTDIGLAYFGDGAAEEGVVHESFNLARIQKTPVLFVVENNLFASHMHISLRQPSNMIARFALANDIPYSVLDGNDVVSIASVSEKLINDMRNGKGPALLEVVTYRWYGHVDWRDDVDVGVERSLKDVENWKARDPIDRLSRSMIQAGIWNKKYEDELNDEIDEKIKTCWEKAMKDSYPKFESTLKFVYS